MPPLLSWFITYITNYTTYGIFFQHINIFTNAEVLFEMMPKAVAKMSKHHDTAIKLGVKFNWGITNGREMESCNSKIKFIEEWNYFDYHRDRCHWMRLTSLIAAFKNRFNNRIVHLKFSK